MDVNTIFSQINTIGIIILIILTVIILFILFFYLFGSFRPLPPAPLKPTNSSFPELNWDIGASKGNPVNYNNGLKYNSKQSCLSATYTNWNGLNCVCNNTHYGPDCSLPIFDSNYYVLGQAVTGTLDLKSISKQTVNGVSFDPNGNDATTICNNISGCIGFTYLDATKEAEFFSEMELMNGHFNYNINQAPFYYMKRGERPLFLTRVFLTRGKLSLRYWLLDINPRDSESQWIGIDPNTVYTLTFIPDNITNDGNLTGVISDNPFDYRDLDKYVNEPRADMIVIKSNKLPTFPSSWSLPFYVGFTRSN